MNPTVFLLLNTVVVILIVIWFLRGRQNDPTRLTLMGRSRERTKALPGRAAPPVPYKGPTPAKELTIYFEFGGLKYEAHEVLEIAAGVSAAVAEEAYRQAVKAQPAQQALLSAALVAIRKSRG